MKDKTLFNTKLSVVTFSVSVVVCAINSQTVNSIRQSQTSARIRIQDLTPICTFLQSLGNDIDRLTGRIRSSLQEKQIDDMATIATNLDYIHTYIPVFICSKVTTVTICSMLQSMNRTARQRTALTVTL